MKIPEIDHNVLFPICEELAGPNSDPYWIDNFTTRLSIEQPVLHTYLCTAKEQYGEGAALTGLLVYRFIESQLEVDELEELYGDT